MTRAQTPGGYQNIAQVRPLTLLCGLRPVSACQCSARMTSAQMLVDCGPEWQAQQVRMSLHLAAPSCRASDTCALHILSSNA